MMEGYPEGWQHYIKIVEGNVKRLAKLESAIEQNHNLVLSFKEDIDEMRIQIKEMHNTIYKNGLSSKVDALWDKKEAIGRIDTIWDRIKILDRITVGVVTALLTAIVLYFFSGSDNKAINHQVIENLQKIEKKLDAIDKD
ncbi:MAG: hypothetical protein KDE62_02880 [Calditrichaeota bacterium]|nr:hypothetical protein [Calditrichota bacterium]